ncbi:hypothetical protein LTR53_016526 [Teratosphaeriaceae sp. CCFEE 6253]|nr:hypothetical protein LTR53_016526 [Teratosphaeriaceae sp. CCFEE 6253]
MPHHLFSFAGHGPASTDDSGLQEMEHERPPPKQPRRRPSFLKNIGSRLKRHHEQHDAEPLPQTAPPEPSCPPPDDYFVATRRRSLQDPGPASRRAIPSLPRPQTFLRQQSERRERLLEVEPSPKEKRALSADQRPRGFSSSVARRPQSPKPLPGPAQLSGSDIHASDHHRPSQNETPQALSSVSRGLPADLPPLQIPDQGHPELDLDDEDDEQDLDQAALREEYDQRWILNLSMHFRDKSNREKFFVTFADQPSRWRRLTISLDYRDAPADSLEADLSTLHYQRDKSFRIYEAIRESLAEIQYYATVTNLKLETTPADGQLHVHVREDANEIIPYPAIALFQHVQTRLYRESQLELVSHLSGFVYKVLADDALVIKKEIPGPDTVDEFLYEVNALDSLVGCENVVQLKGLVTDDSGSVVKALLISYAAQGALVDMLYDFRDTPELPWRRREKWAAQIVRGLADIHEAGFVQGDFTLSNIVIDAADNALIIDINRRGCPVGWEPPELRRLIHSGQRVGMHIGVKTDLFQLGMVLWALAEEVDEPDRLERPLPPVLDSVPAYFRRMVETCLSDLPRCRVGAQELCRALPVAAARSPSPCPRRWISVDSLREAAHPLNDSVSTHRSDREYVDPAFVVTLDEVRRPRPARDPRGSLTSAGVTYVDPESNPASTSYRFESAGSWVIGHQRRGRSPVSSRRRRSSPYGRTASSVTSVDSEPPSRLLQRLSNCDDADQRSIISDEIGRGSVEGMQYPPTISDEDLGAAAVQPEGGRDLSLGDGSKRSPGLVDRRVQGVPGTGLPQLVHTDSGFDELSNSPVGSQQSHGLLDRRLQSVRATEYTHLVHTDSGFDEIMGDEITTGETAEQSVPSPSDLKGPHDGTAESKSGAVDLPPPSSFHAAAALPTDLRSATSADEMHGKQ